MLDKGHTMLALQRRDITLSGPLVDLHAFCKLAARQSIGHRLERVTSRSTRSCFSKPARAIAGPGLIASMPSVGRPASESTAWPQHR
jgi:hypothetical protein